MNLQLSLLILAGAGHFGIVTASMLVPRALDWKTQLAPLHPFMRRLFWVYGIFITLATVIFGALTLIFAREMAAGDPVGRGLAAAISLYWAARLIVQWFVFDSREFRTTIWHSIGEHVLTAGFVFVTVVYAWVAID
ncbi:MAG: hypothetical protein V4733_08735 [Verrucomicrobiota bacterium]